MKCSVCGSEKFIVDKSFGGADQVCGSCGTIQGEGRPMKDVTPPPPKLPATKEFSPEQLLKQWLVEGGIESLILVGTLKEGGWKYGTSGSSFEFLAGGEGVIQKLKLAALEVVKKK